MAGIRAMGDLSHEVESFLAVIEAGTSQADGAALEVLQASLDELHRMREMANSGQRIPAARDLIQQLRSLAAAPPAAEDTFAGLAVEARDEEPVADVTEPLADEGVAEIVLETHAEDLHEEAPYEAELLEAELHEAEPHEEALHEEIVLEAAADEPVAEAVLEPFAVEPVAEASVDAELESLVELTGEPLATTAAEDEFAAIFAVEPESPSPRLRRRSRRQSRLPLGHPLRRRLGSKLKRLQWKSRQRPRLRSRKSSRSLLPLNCPR